MINELKRVWFLLVVTVLLSYVFASGYYEYLPSVLQTALDKFLLVVSGLLTAHVVRKSLLPDVDWSNDSQWQLTSAVIAFYLIVVYCFSMGG
jgi:hypothetical protein